MKRRSSKNTEDIKDVLKKLVLDIEKQGPGTKDIMSEAWDRIVGAEGARHSRPVGIKKRVLTIEVDNSAWFYALNLRKISILKDLKLQLKEEKIEDIRFRMGDEKR
ncbi:MAG: DUF721 domain-containing protein [Candidatus Omnitrophota bacterium]